MYICNRYTLAYLIESARSYDLYLAPMNHVRRTPFKVQYLPAKNGVRFKHLNNINFHSLFMRSNITESGRISDITRYY